jgi:hypothetical protein
MQQNPALKNLFLIPLSFAKVQNLSSPSKPALSTKVLPMTLSAFQITGTDQENKKRERLKRSPVPQASVLNFRLQPSTTAISQKNAGPGHDGDRG